MAHRDIVVIGGSAGSLEVLKTIFSRLPHDLPAAIFVVVHTSADNPGILPQILAKAGPLPAVHATDGHLIERGHIYIAPPNHHLLVKQDRMLVTRGPRENGFRPAVDPLFRTAARAFGPRTIGVVLSGGLDDGTHGLMHIQRAGGLTVVQDPQTALIESMPLSAIRTIAIDYVMNAFGIGPLIAQLTSDKVDALPPSGEEPSDVAEVGTAALAEGKPNGKPSPITCPQCGGALWEGNEAGLPYFRCHVGHGYTPDGLLAAKQMNLEDVLWTSLRVLEEQAEMQRRLVERTEGQGLRELAKHYALRADDTEMKAALLRSVLTTNILGNDSKTVEGKEQPQAPTHSLPTEPSVGMPASQRNNGV
jgi:two-component system chemotaxis response regulator CheB